MQISHSVPLWVTWAPFNCHLSARVGDTCTVDYCMSLSLRTSLSALLVPENSASCHPVDISCTLPGFCLSYQPPEDTPFI